MGTAREKEKKRPGKELDAKFSVNQFGETVLHMSSSEDTADAGPSSSKLEMPASVGRYEIRDILGRGAFGAVFLGYDDQLERQVAIKVREY